MRFVRFSALCLFVLVTMVSCGDPEPVQTSTTPVADTMLPVTDATRPAPLASEVHMTGNAGKGNMLVRRADGSIVQPAGNNDHTEEGRQEEVKELP